MSRLHTSFVLGYHGCLKAVAKKLVECKASPSRSARDYDWLGPGFYVWESDPLRALEWAKAKGDRDKRYKPCVVGVVIDLGNCLDLSNRDDLAMVVKSYDDLVETCHKAGQALPQNQDIANDKHQNKLIRNLDCAVIKNLHRIASSDKSDVMRPFDTVRAPFLEGGDLYPGSGFAAKAHVQIAVVNLNCIKGIFHHVPTPTD